MRSNLNIQNINTRATKIANNGSTLLDPVIINDNMNSLYYDVLNMSNGISDHSAAIAYQKSFKTSKHFFTREMRKYDPRKLDKN